MNLKPAHRTFIYNLILGVLAGVMVYVETSFFSLSLILALIMIMVLMQFEYMSNEASIRFRDILLLNEKVKNIHYDLHHHTHKLPVEETNETKHT